MVDFKKSRIINLLAWCVIASNVILFVIYYLIISSGAALTFPKYVSFFSMLAVFPLEFFFNYLSDFKLAQIIWILMIIACAFGILLLNKLARIVFIFLNIVHVVVLAYIVSQHYGEGLVFLEYFFKLYFTLVASGTYAGYLTIPEIRAQFTIDLEKIKFRTWFDKFRVKTKMPKNADDYFNLGLAYARLGRNYDAIKSLQKAVSVNPDKEEYHFNLGMLFIKEEKYAEAIAALKESVRLNPIYMEATYTLGLIYRKTGCDREAAEVFERAANIQPDNFQVLRDLGKTYLTLGKYEAAHGKLEAALQLNKRDAESHFCMGKIFLECRDDPQKARDMFSKAVLYNPVYLDGYFYLGLTDIKLKKYKDAIRHFKEVLKLDETHVKAHYQLGFSYAMIKDLGSARRECGIVGEVDPDLAKTLQMLIS